VSPTSGRSATNSVAGSISFSCNAFSTPLETPGHDRSAGRMLGMSGRREPPAITRRENGRCTRSTLATRWLVSRFTEETAEILIEADSETLPEERRRFALLNTPRHLLTKPPLQQREPSSCNIGLKEISAPRLACGFGAFIHDPDRCLKTAPPPFPKRDSGLTHRFLAVAP
jgi:hypothetical protein